jgi:hypothetical protein
LLGAVLDELVVVVVVVLVGPAAAAASEAAEESAGAPLSTAVVVVVDASDCVVVVSAFLQPPSPHASPADRAIANTVRLTIRNPPNPSLENDRHRNSFRTIASPCRPVANRGLSPDDVREEAAASGS